MTSRVCISQQQQQQHNNPLTSFCHVRVYYNISYSVPTNGPTQIKILKIGSDQRERKSRQKKGSVAKEMDIGHATQADRQSCDRNANKYIQHIIYKQAI